jgi:integrase
MMARRGDGIYSRGTTWWLDFTHEGRRHFVRLGKGITRTVAREIAQVKRAAILKGEAGIGRKRADITFDKAAERLLTWAREEKRPKTAVSYAECVTQLKRSFAGRRLSEITAFTVEKHKRMRLAEGARVAPNRELSILRLLVNRALAAGVYQGDNPARGFKRIPESEGRVRWLEPDEEAALLAELVEPYRTLVLVGLHAGLRVRAEALTLTWREVDLVRGLLTVQAAYAKTRRQRVIRINSALRGPLVALKAATQGGPEDAVFRRRDGQPLRALRSVFARACARAKLTDVTPHVLRHTFASRLAMMGVPLRSIQELGGWRSLKMVERYAHLSPEYQADAVEKLAAFPDAIHDTPAARLKGLAQVR